VLFPQVTLTASTTFLNGVAATASDTGMLVYNTNTATNTGLIGAGYYHWNGTQWEKFTAAGDLLWDLDRDTGVQVEESPNENTLRFDTAGTERMQIDPNGNVGIGTDPTDALHVDGDVRITGTLKDASNSAGSSGHILTSTATGTAWVPRTPGISLGKKTWEFADNNGSELLTTDLGFTVSSWNKIPLNSTPQLINTTGGAAGFTFNADGSIQLEAGRVYRISATTAAYYLGASQFRLVEVGTTVPVIESARYSYGNTVIQIQMEGFYAATVTADYQLELYFNNPNSSYQTTNFNVVLTRASLVVEVLQ
jgi:hypothetical protein